MKTMRLFILAFLLFALFITLASTQLQEDTSLEQQQEDEETNIDNTSLFRGVDENDIDEVSEQEEDANRILQSLQDSTEEEYKEDEEVVQDDDTTIDTISSKEEEEDIIIEEQEAEKDEGDDKQEEQGQEEQEDNDLLSPKVTQDPVTDNEEPLSEEPLEEATVEVEADEGPLVEDPLLEEPNEEEPNEETLVEEPLLEEPTEEEPNEETLVEEPIVEEPIEETFVEEPLIEELLVEEATEEPLVEEEPLLEEPLEEEEADEDVVVLDPFSDIKDEEYDDAVVQEDGTISPTSFANQDVDPSLPETTAANNEIPWHRPDEIVEGNDKYHDKVDFKESSSSITNGGFKYWHVLIIILIVGIVYNRLTHSKKDSDGSYLPISNKMVD